MFRWLILLAAFVIGYLLVNRLMSRSRGSRDSAEPERATMSNWYRILEVRENASLDEIRTAYRHRISEYHPDKFATADADARAVAEARAKQINAAYEIGVRLFER